MVVLPGHHAGQLPQDLFFGVGVNARKRVVENQDARIADHGPRDRGALFLPAGESDPRSPTSVSKPFGKFQNFRQDIGNFRRALHLASRTRPACQT